MVLTGELMDRQTPDPLKRASGACAMSCRAYKYPTGYYQDSTILPLLVGILPVCIPTSCC